MTNSILFTETQRFRQWWIWLLILAAVAVAWWAFYVQIIEGHPYGDKPAPDGVVWLLFALMGCLLPGLMLVLRLETSVTLDQVRVAFRPIHARYLAREEIVSAQARDFRPFLDYGGWGIRWSPVRGWCYTVAGKQGVEIDLTDGRKVLIGSARADDLARAINQALAS